MRQILLRATVSNDDAAVRGREVLRTQIVQAVANRRGKGRSEQIASLVASQLLGPA
jgi:hypothetical protein